MDKHYEQKIEQIKFLIESLRDTGGIYMKDGIYIIECLFEEVIGLTAMEQIAMLVKKLKGSINEEDGYSLIREIVKAVEDMDD